MQVTLMPQAMPLFQRKQLQFGTGANAAYNPSYRTRDIAITELTKTIDTTNAKVSSFAESILHKALFVLGHGIIFGLSVPIHTAAAALSAGLSTPITFGIEILAHGLWQFVIEPKIAHSQGAKKAIALLEKLPVPKQFHGTRDKIAANLATFATEIDKTQAGTARTVLQAQTIQRCLQNYMDDHPDAKRDGGKLFAMQAFDSWVNILGDLKDAKTMKEVTPDAKAKIIKELAVMAKSPFTKISDAAFDMAQVIGITDGELLAASTHF